MVGVCVLEQGNYMIFIPYFVTECGQRDKLYVRNQIWIVVGFASQ